MFECICCAHFFFLSCPILSVKLLIVYVHKIGINLGGGKDLNSTLIIAVNRESYARISGYFEKYLLLNFKINTWKHSSLRWRWMDIGGNYYRNLARIWIFFANSTSTSPLCFICSHFTLAAVVLIMNIPQFVGLGVPHERI